MPQACQSIHHLRRKVRSGPPAASLFFPRALVHSRGEEVVPQDCHSFHRPGRSDLFGPPAACLFSPQILGGKKCAPSLRKPPSPRTAPRLVCLSPMHSRGKESVPQACQNLGRNDLSGAQRLVYSFPMHSRTKESVPQACHNLGRSDPSGAPRLVDSFPMHVWTQ